MGFFSSSSKSTSTTAYKPGEWQKQGMDYFSDLLKQGGQYPQMQIEGMTPFQQQIQGYMNTTMPAYNENYKAAMDQLMLSVNGGYDPMTSPQYTGFRDEAQRLKAEAVTADKQYAQSGGMLRSFPAAGVQSQTRQGYDSLILNQLAKLQSEERNRQFAAAGMIPGMEAQHLQTLGGASDLANMPRQIEQMRNEQEYQTALNDFLFPYTVQANISNALINSNWGAKIVGTTTSSSTPSTWSNIASVAGAATGVMTGFSNMGLNNAQSGAFNAQANYYNSLYR